MAVTVLKLDIDEELELPSVAQLCALLRRSGHRPHWLQYARSGSGHGWHLRLAVTPRCTITETIALQAILGSDRYREANNLMRARQLPKVPGFWRRAGCVNVLYDPLF